MIPHLYQQTTLWLSPNKRPQQQAAAHARSSSAITASRLILVLGLFLVTLDLQSTGVDSCGVTLHNEIAFRASQILLSAAGPDESSQSLSKQPLSLARPYPHSQSVLHSNVKGTAPPNAHWHERELPYQSSALYDYASLLTQKGALFAGSFFPDWGYNCIGKLWNQAAEEAHWPPFTEAAVKYILETYPKPWSDHTKTLIVFLFGTVSHSLGDLSWHGLRGLDAGFIRALASSSFGGDYSEAHTLADIGAEFVLSHMSPMNHLLSSWKVPIKDITEIYKRMGYHVPGMVLSHCMRNGFAGAQANARLGSQLFPVYASKSPFLVEQLEHYPMGGLRDMTEWTVECWNGLAAYLDEERPLPDGKNNSTSFNLCYALWEGRTGANGMDAIQRSGERMVRHEHSHPVQGAHDFEHALKRLSLAGLTIESITDEVTGMVTFSIKSDEQISSEHVDENEVTSAPRKAEQHHASLEPPHIRESSKDENRSGGAFQSTQAQTRFLKPKPPSAKNNPKLTYQEPSYSTSTQRSGACLPFADESESQARTFYLPIAYSSFGHAAVNGDFDGDGHMDLAIAAPHTTINPLVPSQGSVFIVPGRSVFGETEHLKRNSTKDGDADSGIDVRLVASRVLHGSPTEPQSRFGWSLAVVDLNKDGIDDLAVGAPGHGAKNLTYDGSIYVYFGHAGTGLSEEPDLVIHHDRASDSEQEGMSGSLAGLGYVVEGLDLTGSGFKDLVVGMPMATTPKRDGDQEGDHQMGYNQQAGKVIAFLSASGHAGQKLDTECDWALQGQDVFGWFGASFTVMDADSDPGSTAGSASPKSSRLWRVLSWLFPFLPHYGMRGKFLMSNDERRKILVVGSPTFGLSEDDAMRGKIQGYLIPSSGMFSLSFRRRSSLGPELLPKKLFTIYGDTKFQQLGSRLASNRIVLETPACPHSHQHTPALRDFLVIGSQSEGFSNRLPRLGRHWQAGKVRILDITQLQAGAEAMISDLDLDPSIVRDSLRGSQSMAHLSAAMRVSTDGKSLWLAEPYAKSEAGRIVEWEPSHSKEDGGEYHGRRSRGSPRITSKSWLSKEANIAFEANGQRRDRGGDGDGGDDDEDDEKQEQILQCFIGSDFRGRFGSQLLVADLNNDGLDDIMVTSSHSSQYAAMAGTVVIKFRS
ncbi:Glycosylphosphatidylinositol specific phospholipase D1 [Mortierella alpina]|nr:Glycosylphosphatidylinositol specific phospholipase D1 [Mortierella alpina]